MKKMQVSYNAASVREDYARRHPDRPIVGLYEDREAAFDAVYEKPGGRLIDLSYGFLVVFDKPI